MQRVQTSHRLVCDRASSNPGPQSDSLTSAIQSDQHFRKWQTVSQSQAHFASGKVKDSYNFGTYSQASFIDRLALKNNSTCTLHYKIYN
ncbi:hypothetical protein KC366_g79 [Hortaea werneckii]|nr:hypothetical protein KC366_g79 [Hortaea werneckii]